MMDPSSQQPITIHTPGRAKPKCPGCASEMILIGSINDSSDSPVCFAVLDRFGGSHPQGNIRACYCNDCGEVTLTLE